MVVDEQGLILVTLGALLLVGVLAQTVGRRTHVPGVTLLLLLGVAVGPSVLDLVPAEREVWFPLLARVALVLIGFLLGHEFKLDALRVRGAQVVVVSLVVTLATAACVSAGTFLLGLPLGAALLLGVIATATDPAATVAVVHESGAKGSFTHSLLGIVAVDDVWGLTLFSLALPFAALLTGNADGWGFALDGLRELAGGAALGLALGLPMAMLTGRLRAGEPTKLEALGFVLLCGGLAAAWEVSYLLASIVMGATVANLARHHEVAFHEIENIETPFLVSFFLLAGAGLEVATLTDAGFILVGYVAFRVIGRMLGADLGARLAGAPTMLGRWMGLALLPQAGVALGLALAVGDRFPEFGDAILSLVIGGVVIFELSGPPLTRLALQRAGEIPRTQA
jgi:Kef-type K+ transport system membrane component KefB